MYRIVGENISKVYNKRRLFSAIHFEINIDESLAILGSNGTGKSTLLKIIAGQTSPTEGKVIHYENNKLANEDSIYKKISWATPALEYYTYLTVIESLKLHFKFKQNLASIEEILHKIHLDKHKDKPLRMLSSGMLQRFRLGLALFSHAPILILDEPTAFMDSYYTDYFLKLIEEMRMGRIYILASNALEEYKHINKKVTLNVSY